MSAGASPIGSRGRVTSTGAIQPGRTGEVMVSIRGGVESFLARDVDGGSIDPYTEIVVVDYEPPRLVLVVIGQQIAEQLPDIVRAASESFKHVDNLTVLNGAQGISEIIAQVIGQAGPALRMAQEALGRTNGAQPEEKSG